MVGAFFDLDGTILTRSSGNLYLEYAYRQRKVSLFVLLRSYLWYLEHWLGFLDVDKVARKGLKMVRGMKEQEVVDFCCRWFDEMVKDYINPQVVEMIEEHRGQGHLTVVLSGSTSYAVAPVAEYLKMDGYICTRLEVADGRFTGRAIEPLCYGRGKLYWAEIFCRERGIDMAQSFFYTDSITDLPVLEAFGHPCVLDPDPRLRKEALKRGWTVVDTARGK